MAEILIAGCGYVGSELARKLVAEGHTVWGLRRRTSALPPGVHPIAADLSRPETLEGLPAVTHVAYCASANERTESAYERAYVSGIENLVAALAHAPLERLVFTSSTAVYGQSDGRLVDEASGTFPTHFSGQVLLTGERLVVSLPCSGVVLRLAGIYGPGRTRLVRSVHEGRARPAPGAYGNRIHRDDCAGAAAHLLFHRSPDPVYLGVDDDPAPLDEVHAFVASILGVPFPPVDGPEAPAAGERERGGKRCTNQRLRASGYAFTVPTYREGYPPIIEEYLAEVASGAPSEPERRQG